MLRATMWVLLALSVPLQTSAQNVVLIIADDVGVDGVAAYGEQPNVGPTPNIDSLAAQGVLFRNAWTDPICSPSRSSMLTGTSPARHLIGWYIDPNEAQLKTGLDPGIATLPKQLRTAGYRTAAFGKYHVGDSWVHPLQMGFDFYAGFLWGGVSYYFWPRTMVGTAVNGVSYPVPLGYPTYYTTQYATTNTANDVISELGGSEPFFFWVAFLAAHSPFEPPPQQLHSYDLSSVPVSGNEPLYQKAMTEAMDTEIGRILAAIDWSDTTVIFIGDNGTPSVSVELPFIAAHAKFTVYEGGVNVPLMVAGQAVAQAARGRESAALVQSTDLFKTILDIAGVSGGAPDSISFAPLLTNPGQPSIRSWTYAEAFLPNGGPIDPGRRIQAARGPRYKLHRQNTTIYRFFDLENDPWELQPLNIAALTPTQQSAYNQLSLVIQNAPEPGMALQLGAGIASLVAIERTRKRRSRKGRAS